MKNTMSATELKAWTGPGSSRLIKEAFNSAGTLRVSIVQTLDTLTRVIRTQRSTKPTLSQDDREWLGDVLKATEATAAEIRALLQEGESKASDLERRRVMTGHFKLRARMRKSGL